MSFFRKIGRALKRVAVPALGIAGAAMGIPAVGSAIGGLFSAKQGSSGSFTPETGAPDMSEYSGQPTVSVQGQKSLADSLAQYAPLASGAIGYLGQVQTNQANARMAQQQMEFQAQQSGTSYQRGVADMQAAGLNPMLAYHQGGASSGAGATATMGNELGAGANSALSVAQTLQQLELVQSQIERQQAETRLLGSQDSNTQADTLHKRALTTSEGYRPGHIKADTDWKMEDTRRVTQDIILRELEAQMARDSYRERLLMYGSARRAKDAEEALSRANTGRSHVETTLSGARIPEAAARGRIAEGAANMVPHLNQGVETINSGKSWLTEKIPDWLEWLDNNPKSGSWSDALREYGKRKH